ncbi:MAG: hypothetical protein HYZ53_00650 [Planctomycetes bacterium]|nr:hypothetical protein [Planctomycetota bacterium]
MPQFLARSAVGPIGSSPLRNLHADGAVAALLTLRDRGLHGSNLYRFEESPKPRYVGLFPNPNWPLAPW